jgi:CRP-like cAMP-binding protein
LPAIENHLIELLPRNDRQRLLDVCEPIHLVLADVIQEPGAATRHAYFPVDGFVSLVAQIDGHPGLEVGMVGREGMLGSNLVLGVEISPLRALVQGAGAAWRITAADFRRELARSAPLQRVLDLYIQVSLSQLAASAACLRFHQIGPRLARWLLMSQDRAHADSFHVTQEFLAYMLGVRRVGITQAAGSLQRSGLIAYNRGTLNVVDRTGLEAKACACYAADRKSYAGLL